MSVFSTLYAPTGAAIGLLSAAPVGPVNLLVIQRTLTAPGGGPLLIGAAAAVGDALFAAAAAFGVTAIADLLKDHALGLHLVGALILIVFAVVTWRSQPKLREDTSQGSTVRMAATTLTLTLTNPATVGFFFGAFGLVGFTGIGHDSPEHLVNAAEVVAGAFAGSMLWWLIVTWLARRLRDRITDRHLTLLNHGTAVLLGVFAVAAVVSGVTAR